MTGLNDVRHTLPQKAGSIAHNYVKPRMMQRDQASVDCTAVL
jgi:hypothetical protein